MSLNNIQLQEFIIEEWYSDNLLPSPKSADASAPSKPNAFATLATPPPPSATVPQSPAPQTSTLSPLKYLGNNRRHIAILVHSPGSPFLPDNQLNFLTKILEACRMTIADVAIVNNATTETNIATVKDQLHPKTTLLFGLEPSALRLPINFPPFKPLEYDGSTYLSAPGLDHLVLNTEESKLLKTKLWVCLKTIFDV